MFATNNKVEAFAKQDLTSEGRMLIVVTGLKVKSKTSTEDTC